MCRSLSPKDGTFTGTSQNVHKFQYPEVSNKVTQMHKENQVPIFFYCNWGKCMSNNIIV